MSQQELYDLINSLADDIEFDYKGKHGAICPFSRDDIVVSYGEVEIRVSSVEQAMNEKIFDGLCLSEISEEIIIY